MFAVFVLHLQKLDSDTRPEARRRDLPERPEFLFLDPQSQPDSGPLFQGAGHLDKASPEADVSHPSRDVVGIAGRVELHRSIALLPRILAALVETSGADGVLGPGGRQREIPYDVLRPHTLQASQIFGGNGDTLSPANLLPFLDAIP